MQGQKPKQQVLFKNEDMEHFQEKTSTQNKKLICIDVHLGWCGRCSAMEQNYRNLHLKFDEDFEHLEFFSAAEEILPDEIMSTLTYGPLTCKPRFLLFYNG